MGKENIARLNVEQVKAKNVIKKEQDRINSRRYRQNCSRNKKLRVEGPKKYKTLNIPYRLRKQDENEKQYYHSKKVDGMEVKICAKGYGKNNRFFKNNPGIYLSKENKNHWLE